MHVFRPKDRPADRPRDRKEGFTLIEVLVATAVMAIMIVMLGGVFQQASSSWDSGYVRAEGGMAVRAVAGALTRDLATAVDGRRYGMSTPLSLSPGENGTGLTFWRLRDGAKDGNDVEKVTYDSKGDRNGKALFGQNSGAFDPPSFTYYAGPDTTSLRSYESDSDFSEDNGVVWRIPYVKVRCELTRRGTFSGLRVRSGGRDGVKDRDWAGDDIVVQ